MHVVGPQLGLTQPGMTVVCGDSHTSTHGAFGALAFGIGTSEVEHVLATQTLPLKPFRTMAVTVDGDAARRGHRQGPRSSPSSPGSAPAAARATSSSTAARPSAALSMEARMTVCNMSIEAGARAGMIAPDQTTFDYLQGRPHAPHRRRLGRRAAGNDAYRRATWELLDDPDGETRRLWGPPLSLSPGRVQRRSARPSRERNAWMPASPRETPRPEWPRPAHGRRAVVRSLQFQ